MRADRQRFPAGKHCLLGRRELICYRIDARMCEAHCSLYVCVYTYARTRAYARAYVRNMQLQTEQSHVKLVAIGVLQTRGASHLGADHGDTHGRGRRRGQQARLHPCKWCTARTVLPKESLSFICLPRCIYARVTLSHAGSCTHTRPPARTRPFPHPPSQRLRESLHVVELTFAEPVRRLPSRFTPPPLPEQCLYV